MEKQHEPWCDMMEAAGFGSMDNKCTCDPLYNHNLAQKWYDGWRMADKERYQLAKYIMSQEQPHQDYACSQCVGDGDLVKKGFVCGYHKAVEIVFNKVVEGIE